MLTLHRTWRQLIKKRTQTINSLQWPALGQVACAQRRIGLRDGVRTDESHLRNVAPPIRGVDGLADTTTRHRLDTCASARKFQPSHTCP